MSTTVIRLNLSDIRGDAGIFLCFMLAVLPVAAWTREPVETAWPNGAVKERYYVIQTTTGITVKEGVYTAFFENGNRKSEITYHKGKKDGPSRSWYMNGQLRCLLTYKEGSLNGPAKWYHQDGGLAIVGYYGENGQREYLWELFLNRGDPCARITYAEGRIEKKEYFAPDSVIEALFREMENPKKKR